MTEDADQVEIEAMQFGSASVDAGIYDDVIAGAMDDFDVSPELQVHADWHAEDVRKDNAYGAVYEELLRRSIALQDKYPFKVENGTIRWTRDQYGLYEFFLGISYAPSLTEGEFKELPRLFERFAAELVARYFGDWTKAVHFGYPRKAEVGKRFKDAAKYLHDLTGEWHWGPDFDLPDEGPVSGDEGCDFVIWHKPSDGRRMAQLFVLGQCACGGNWDVKLHDLDIGKLKKWFNPGWIVEPVKVFATPRHVVDDMLKDASKSAGFIFDRSRLTAIAADGKENELLHTFENAHRALIELVMDARRR